MPIFDERLNVSSYGLLAGFYLNGDARFNRPTAGANAWATIVVSGTTAQWYEIDITPQVQAARAANQTTVAIALQAAADTLPYVTFSARETANAPRLVITP